jgi:phospholipid-translocating ATPase
LPKVLWAEFSQFSNLFFLGVALSQFVPFLKVGFLFTFLGPLCFVLMITMGKEIYDDFVRMIQDRELNNKVYKVLRRHEHNGSWFKDVKSKDIKVGQIIRVDKDTRVPADLIVLKYSGTGNIFVKTD